MNPTSIHSVLSNLIALTNERDVFELERLLAQSLFDLIAPLNADGTKSVVIYRAIDLKKQLFSVVVIGKKSKDDHLSIPLKSALVDCFRSGDFCDYIQAGEPHTTLYPLKNATTGQTMAIIAIEAQITDPQLHETITMLLQIHQNFAGLVSDNELDTLTGLLNRKTFDIKINKVLAQMHKKSKRRNDKTNQVYFLAIFDIDHFKNVNDKYGHLVGDEVLKKLSQLMTQTFRDKDMLFRFGGEEFVGIFKCENAAEIQAILDRFREKVGNVDFSEVGKVTVSAGYTEILADDTSSQVIGRADEALYFAKNNGRNRVCFYEHLLQERSLIANQ